VFLSLMRGEGTKEKQALTMEKGGEKTFVFPGKKERLSSPAQVGRGQRQRREEREEREVATFLEGRGGGRGKVFGMSPEGKTISSKRGGRGAFSP